MITLLIGLVGRDEYDPPLRNVLRLALAELIVFDVPIVAILCVMWRSVLG